MTSEQAGVMVYRDDDGNLYLRVPEAQKAGVEAALEEQDVQGYGEGGGGIGLVRGGLTPVGGLLRLSTPLQLSGIIIVGGRQR